jgi:hypothetical protein
LKQFYRALTVCLFVCSLVSAQRQALRASAGAPAAAALDASSAPSPEYSTSKPYGYVSPFAYEPDASGQRTEVGSDKFNWDGAARQSFYFLSIQHGMRMMQRKTRRELGGKFWPDYVDSIAGVEGWGDGDSFLTNYVGHPMQGGITAWIQIQNDPKGMNQEIAWRNQAYWHSRLKAMAWSALYSTQFELGPVSEASIGNVGIHPGTNGMVDLVVTPTAGFGMILGEDLLDKYVVKRLEDGTDSVPKRRFYRIFFNPERAVANVLRLKVPWHRDSRGLREGIITSNQGGGLAGAAGTQ